MATFVVILPRGEKAEMVEADTFTVDAPSHILNLHRGDKLVAAFVDWMGVKEMPSATTTSAGSIKVTGTSLVEK